METIRIDNETEVITNNYTEPDYSTMTTKQFLDHINTQSYYFDKVRRARKQARSRRIFGIAI